MEPIISFFPGKSKNSIKIETEKTQTEYPLWFVKYHSCSNADRTADMAF